MFGSIQYTMALWIATMRMRKFEQILLKGIKLDEGQERLLKSDLEVENLGDTKDTLNLIDKWFTQANMHYRILREKEERERKK